MTLDDVVLCREGADVLHAVSDGTLSHAEGADLMLKQLASLEDVTGPFRRSLMAHVHELRLGHVPTVEDLPRLSRIIYGLEASEN